jgi:hypothetical protein
MTDPVYCPPNVDCPCYAALTAENERLRAENDKIRRTAAVWMDAHVQQSELALKYVFELNGVIAERNEVVAENERLRAALEPFAKAGNNFDSCKAENAEIWFVHEGVRSKDGFVGAITVGDVRRARAALEGKP